MASEAFDLETVTGVLGNALEWYDFALYGFFSDVLAGVFFPPSDSGNLNLIMSYLIFGCAFVMRPIGGCIMGNIGDMYGRKRALVLSLFVMSVPTVAMGFLPTYKQVGGWSTALLLICRMMQGFSVGGQYTSSIVYTLERKPKDYWGYYGAFVNMGASTGVILGNIAGALLRTVLTDEQLTLWGWRAAFFSGILVLPVAISLNIYGQDHHPNEGEYDINQEDEPSEEEGGLSASPVSRRKHPLREAVKRENWGALCSSILAPMLAGGGYYLTVVWMAIFMETLIDPPVGGAFWVNLAANIFLGLSQLFAGWLSDQLGRVKLMTFGAISVGVVAPLMVWVISWGRTVPALFAQIAISVLLSFYGGPLNAWLVEKFPPRIRLTSLSLGYNLGICISGGFAPASATALLQVSKVAPGFIYTFLAVIGLIGMFISTKIHQDGGVDSDSDTAVKARTQQDYIHVEPGLGAPLL